jgi:hypothetical protein
VFLGLFVRTVSIQKSWEAYSTSTREKKFLNMKVWYDSGWSRGIPTYSSYRSALQFTCRWETYHVDCKEEKSGQYCLVLAIHEDLQVMTSYPSASFLHILDGTYLEADFSFLV